LQSSADGNPLFPAPFFGEVIISSIHIFGTFVENQMDVVAWDCVRLFYFIPLVFMSAFLCQYHAVLLL
jgi:hypothetical protein